MRGLVVTPGQAGSARVVDDLPEPPEDEGQLLVEGLAVGVCGTDREILAGQYGTAPDPDRHLVLGHESLGRVLADPTGRFTRGDPIAAVVRRPDPVPCPNCAAGEWDMCRNGRYTECGIKQRHGFARERWRVEPDFAVPLAATLGPRGVLAEPAAVVAKAWEHIEYIGGRARWSPGTVLVTGAGPVGLLAALFGAQRGLRVHVLDRAEGGPKPELVRSLGAAYHTGSARDAGLHPDIVLECSGAGPVIVETLDVVAPDGVVCLLGVPPPQPIEVEIGHATRDLVLENNVVFGSVNANRRHWQVAAQALASADPAWLDELITRRVPLADFAGAVDAGPDEVKVVLDLTA